MFSVIIPVHNAEKTLTKCLDSLIAQSHKNFEVLLIENGSTDNSYAICENYSAKDKRFKAYNIGKCSGPSKPRNFGLKNAEGEYIAFLDSDDWLGSRFLEMLYENFLFGKSDIVFFGFCHTNGEKQTCRIFPQSKSITKKQMCIDLQCQDCFGYTCCKAFRKTVLKDLLFDESVDLFEDEIITLQAAKQAKKICLVSSRYDYYYYYYYVDDSMHSIMQKTHYDIIAKKDKEYCAWNDFLDGEYDSFLTKIANSSVSFCRWYIYEHGFDLKTSYAEMVSTEFFSKANNKPNYDRFRLEYEIWRIKTSLLKCTPDSGQ